MKTIFVFLFVLGTTITTHAQQEVASDSITTIIRDGRTPTPLYLVSGKIVSQEVVDTLKPETIARVDILKGAAATEIYGEMAKNGAVLITLKDPKAGSTKKSRKNKSRS